MIGIREDIDNARIGAYHRLLLFLVGLAVFFDGYDTFNASYVIHYVAGTAILFVAISAAALLGACLILLANPRHAVQVAERVEAVRC